ncbi:MAG: hypothetical protein QOG03_1961 [Actinomycetota bacterium]|nr:hypothetical protein [Actinomycetota bacterium]
MENELRELTGELKAAVADAARRGWDVVALRRYIRRRGSARIAALLDYLDGEAGAAGGGVAAWAERYRLSVSQARAEVDEARFWIGIVREMPRFDQAAANDIDPGLLNKVRALLAKAESTDFPAESDALTDKAHELMQRHSIDQALLSGGRPGDVRAHRVLIDDPYARARYILLSGIAQASGCRAIWWQEYGWAVVCGLPGDLAATELLYASLLVQALSSLSAAAVDGDDPPARKAAFRRAFVVAFARRVTARLHDLARTRTAEISHERGIDLLPVLASREAAVEAAIKATSPNVTTMSTRVSDARGWVAGTAAGDRATIATQPALPDLPGQLTA